ncbi:phage tail protein [Achromobacter xylosoxidans]|nr:phage tail protein [Achromobacter xylosoxidans]
MEIFYSAADKGFYSQEIHGNDMPSDCVPLDGGDEEHQTLLEGQAKGKIIVADENGYPQLSEPPPATQAAVQAQILAERDFRLSQAAIRIAPLQDAADIDVATDDERALLLEWKRYRIALNRLDSEEGFPLAVEWPARPGD